MSDLQAKLHTVEDVDIDSNGRFKYVLINVVSGTASEEFSKKIVRGYSWGEYHADIYDAVCARLEPQGFDCQCEGGGRIFVNASEKKIQVYGYSMGFGKANHQTTCDVLKTKYPDYDITWTDEGY